MSNWVEKLPFVFKANRVLSHLFEFCREINSYRKFRWTQNESYYRSMVRIQHSQNQAGNIFITQLPFISSRHNESVHSQWGVLQKIFDSYILFKKNQNWTNTVYSCQIWARVVQISLSSFDRIQNRLYPPQGVYHLD